MELYKNKALFTDAIIQASNLTSLPPTLIEKDYYVIYLLSELNKEIKGLLFKGGTCCSHAYNVIKRFSEDIDLSLSEDLFGRNKNIKANKSVVSVCDRLGFKIINRDQVINHSHGSFNRYYIEYPVSFNSVTIKPYIQIEMSFISKSYPNEIRKVQSILSETIQKSSLINIESFKDLQPFNIIVQKLERTFIDKVFAICDYFETQNVFRNSRHIYDLYMISKEINLEGTSLRKLIQNVRFDRKKSEKSISAHDNYDINLTLKNIISSNFFVSDYNTITKSICSEFIEYNQAITVLQKIIDSNLFAR